MNSRYIKLHLPEYLLGFVLKLTNSKSSICKIGRDTFVGSLIYEAIRKVPEDCNYTSQSQKRKKALLIDISWIGGKNERRINCNTAYYYIPSSLQRDIHIKIEDFFNEVFFNVVNISKQYTDMEYRSLIESFCDNYNIDFNKNYEMLKKRHYRKRMSDTPCISVP